MDTLLAYARDRLHAAALIVVALLAFPIYVPAQTWAAMKADIRMGRTPVLGALSFFVSVVVSIVMATLGLFLVAVPILAIVAIVAS